MEALASIVQHNVAHKVAEVALLGAHRVCGAVQVHVSVPNHLHQLAHEGAFNTLHLSIITCEVMVGVALGWRHICYSYRSSDILGLWQVRCDVMACELERWAGTGTSGTLGRQCDPGLSVLLKV